MFDIVISYTGKTVQVTVKYTVPVGVGGIGVDFVPVSHDPSFWITVIRVFRPVTAAVIVDYRRGYIAVLIHVDGIIRDFLFVLAHEIGNAGYSSRLADYPVAVHVVYNTIAISVKIRPQLPVAVQVLIRVQYAVRVYVPFYVLGVVTGQFPEGLCHVIVFVIEVLA